MKPEIKDLLLEIFNYSDYKLIVSDYTEVKYRFFLNSKEYEVLFTITKPTHYHLSFYIVKDGKPVYELLKDTKEVIKVFSNVIHITQEFLKSNPVKFLIFESLNKKRNILYDKFGNHIKHHFDNYESKKFYTKERLEITAFILSNKGVDYSYYINDQYLVNLEKLIHDIKINTPKFNG